MQRPWGRASLAPPEPRVTDRVWEADSPKTAGGALLGCRGLVVSVGRAREGLGQRAGWPGWLCLQGSAGGPGPGGSRAQPPALPMS